MPERTDSAGRPVVIRPLHPEDSGRHLAFIRSLATEDLRYRFGDRVLALSPGELERIARVDPRRERTFVATRIDAQGHDEVVGEVRLQDDPDNRSTEFAIAVRTDLHGLGIGRALLERAIADCRARGTRMLYGLVVPENAPMLALASRLGFELDHVPGGSTVVVSMELVSDPVSDGAAGS